MPSPRSPNPTAGGSASGAIKVSVFFFFFCGCFFAGRLRVSSLRDISCLGFCAELFWVPDSLFSCLGLAFIAKP